MAYFVYMLRCGDGSLYTGSTSDMDRRLAAHQSGKGAKYTRSRLPVELVYREAAADHSTALRREAAIKKLSRTGKLALIRERSSLMRKMQKPEQARSMEFAWDVVDHCLYAVLSMTAEDGAPYGVPVNIVREGNSVLFHCAKVGKKTDCLRKNPHVCLTCVKDAQIQQARYTTLYSSAIAYGTAAEVTEERDKVAALKLLCKRYMPDNPEGFAPVMAKDYPAVAIWRITVEEITGKQCE